MHVLAIRKILVVTVVQRVAHGKLAKKKTQQCPHCGAIIESKNKKPEQRTNMNPNSTHHAPLQGRVQIKYDKPES